MKWSENVTSFGIKRDCNWLNLDKVSLKLASKNFCFILKKRISIFYACSNPYGTLRAEATFSRYVLPNGSLQGNRASVEVYDQDNNNWSVFEQKRIPENNFDAVEVEGRVYFIINKFPIDIGVSHQGRCILFP